MMEDEAKLAHKKSRYLPPGVDLPCECIYENGKIRVSQNLFLFNKRSLFSSVSAYISLKSNLGRILNDKLYY